MSDAYQRICLLHYHEIGLKGHNRASFELRLLHNAEALLKDFPLVAIHRVSGRLVCFFKEKKLTVIPCYVQLNFLKLSLVLLVCQAALNALVFLM